MNWELATAKNGEATLSLNGVQLYSRYRPREDAWKWVDSEFDESKSCYLLVGLGLGYHAERLIELAGSKPVYIYYFDSKEYELAPLKEAVMDIAHIDFQGCQILIPNSWIKAIGDTHPLLPFLEDIKINQVTYKKSATLMERNSNQNVKRLKQEQTVYPAYEKNIACLVASGPSLNETIAWLKEAKEQMVIFAVGSALKLLLHHDIKPDAIIISDPKENIVNQLKGADYNGYLFYLSTANEVAVQVHKGSAFIVLQDGYWSAEQLSKQFNLPLLETGGSVSTVAISLIEHLQFKKLILFGQDLGFADNETHAQLSTSGRYIEKDLNKKRILANDGSFIWSTPNLQTYRRWIENKVKRVKTTIYTTSAKGAKIEGITLIDFDGLKEVLNE